MFGKVHEVPQNEGTPFHPRSSYGISKVAGFDLTRNYREGYGLFAVSGILFNHESPRRGFEFVTRKITYNVAQIKHGLTKELKLGNLEAKRDFTDVRDMVRAYHLAVEKCEPGEVYNISSGRAYSARDVLEILLSKSKVKVEHRLDPAKMRPSDVPHLVGDSAKFRRATGWEPRIPFPKTLADILDYWRQRV